MKDKLATSSWYGHASTIPYCQWACYWYVERDCGENVDSCSMTKREAESFFTKEQIDCLHKEPENTAIVFRWGNIISLSLQDCSFWGRML